MRSALSQAARPRSLVRLGHARGNVRDPIGVVRIDAEHGLPRLVSGLAV
jgi:hypothetical protein